MAALSPARRVALDVASQARRRNARARDLLRVSPQMASLTPRDRALATRIVLGAVATTGALDEQIDAQLTGGGHLEPRVRDALRLAAFEAIYLDTSAPVAVDQGVEMVRCITPRATGLANAVLRRLASGARPEVSAARARVVAGGTSTRDLKCVSGLPEWLVRSLVASLGPERAAAECLRTLEPAPVFVAANTRLLAPADARTALARAGLDPRPVGLPECFALGAPAGLAPSGLVRATSVLPADLSAQLVVRVAAAPPSRTLLEVGQGRGTKSVLLANVTRSMGLPCHVTALDVDENKVRGARARIERAGLSDEVEGVAFDGRLLGREELPAPLAGSFDVVFVDAPCSGVGTLRRHPEIAWSLEAAALDTSSPTGLPALQLALLTAASARVRKGGALVYSTCSPLVEEDEDVVLEFLQSSAGAAFAIQDVNEAPGVRAAGSQGVSLVAAGTTADGFFRATGAHGSDLHFAARLVRRR